MGYGILGLLKVASKQGFIAAHSRPQKLHSFWLVLRIMTRGMETDVWNGAKLFWSEFNKVNTFFRWFEIPGRTTHQMGGTHFKIQKKNGDPLKNLSLKMVLFSQSYTVDRLLDCEQPLRLPSMPQEFLSFLTLTILLFLSLIYII